jgi:hypothetical protein
MPCELLLATIKEEAMRTTLTIRDDILEAARERAEAYGITIGDALSDLAERGLSTELKVEEEDGFWKGVKFFPHHPDDVPLTLEDIQRITDE